jgi:tetratricopeptide (TPR) repeat protein
MRPSLALGGHLLLLGGTFYGLQQWLTWKEPQSPLVLKQKTPLSVQNKFPFLPFVVFGILFYYLAHAVESSIIPINDVIFEHRTYLPNFGLCLAVGGIIVQLLTQWQNAEIKLSIWSIVVMLLLSLSVMTWFRNQLWRDPIALWSQNVEYAPNKQRAWIILGKHYIQADEPEKGLEALEKAIVRHKNSDGSISVTMTTETLLNRVVALRRLQRYDEALERINQALQTSLRPFDKAKFLVNQGNILYEQRHFAQAEAAYRQAIDIYPQNLNAKLNLANVLLGFGRIGEAEVFYKEILVVDPNNAVAKQNLNKVLQYKQQLLQ